MEVPHDRRKLKFNFGLTCAKYMLFAMNFLFIIIGVIIVSIGISSKVLFESYYYELTNSIQMLSTFWLVVGIVFMFVAVFGIFATFKENTALANMYGIAMVLVFIFQITAAIAGFTLIARSRHMVSGALQSMMERYSWNPSDRMNMDWIQSKYECCGNESPDDWMNFGLFATPYFYNTRSYNTEPPPAWYYYRTTANDRYYDGYTSTGTPYDYDTTTTTTEAPRKNMMPSSCCVPFRNYTNLQCEKHFQNGCFTQMHQVISESIMLIGSSALVFAVVQILGIVLGFMYARIIRRNKSQRDVLVWNSEPNTSRPVYADYTPIDNTGEVKYI